jgi:hypothetical protein
MGVGITERFSGDMNSYMSFSGPPVPVVPTSTLIKSGSPTIRGQRPKFAHRGRAL